MIAEYQQGDEFIDKNINFDAAEDAKKELEENAVIDTENIKKKAKKITTDISECQEDDEVIHDKTEFYTKNTVITTSENVENETTELLA